MSRRVEVGWEYEEQDFRVVCNVTPGTPDRGPDMACAGGYPGDPPEVEVLNVVEDRPGGKSRPDLVALVKKDFDRVLELALDELNYAAEDGPDTTEEARCER